MDSGEFSSLVRNRKEKFRILQFDNLTNLGSIGQGGMGGVYKVHDRRKNTIEALKVNLEQDPDARARFDREARVLRRLTQHSLNKGVPEVLTSPKRYTVVMQGSDAKVKRASITGFTMEYIDGTNLKALSRHEWIHPAHAIRYTHQILESLEELHLFGVVHRDIKPENIVVARDRTVLVDFGLCKDLAWEQRTGEELTKAFKMGVFLGTPDHHSPEQRDSFLARAPIDGRADIYNLALTLHELLTQERTERYRKGETIIDAFRRMSEFTRIQPSSRDIRLTPLDYPLLRALEYNPDDRFQNPGDFHDALKDAWKNISVLRSPVMPNIPQVITYAHSLPEKKFVGYFNRYLGPFVLLTGEEKELLNTSQQKHHGKLFPFLDNQKEDICEASTVRDYPDDGNLPTTPPTMHTPTFNLHQWQKQGRTHSLVALPGPEQSLFTIGHSMNNYMVLLPAYGNERGPEAYIARHGLEWFVLNASSDPIHVNGRAIPPNGREEIISGSEIKMRRSEHYFYEPLSLLQNVQDQFYKSLQE